MNSKPKASKQVYHTLTIHTPLLNPSKYIPRKAMKHVAYILYIKSNHIKIMKKQD